MAPPELVTLYDTIGADAARIPADAVKVAGYATGTPEIVWGEAAWRRFPHAGHVVVDQSAGGGVYAANQAGVYDIESGAGTAARFAELAVRRHAGGDANCGYGSRSSLAAAAAALDATRLPGLGVGWWRGHVDWWLADPNLSIAQATALVGTVLDGFRIPAVQWATPSTNPDTKVPGGTLRSLNLDLSVALASWFPAPPPTVPWQAGALRLARQLETLGTALVTLLEAHQ